MGKKAGELRNYIEEPESPPEDENFDEHRCHCPGCGEGYYLRSEPLHVKRGLVCFCVCCWWCHVHT
eukprot:1357303-Amorphochlora_amoeboformis.AAC.1